MEKYDFSGYATKNDLRCGDGRIIRKNAFIDSDGKKVPLVWNHDHSGPDNVLGHAMLENREDGVFAYGYLNDTERGDIAKQLIQHGDITSLSIYANKLKEVGSDVIHGAIREVSLVLAGANPGAYIRDVIAHSEDGSDVEEMVVNYDEELSLSHADDDKKDEEPAKNDDKKAESGKKEDADKKEKTVEEVFDELTDEQKEAVAAIVGQVVENNKSENNDGEDKNNNDDGGSKEMKHNVFDNEENKKENVLSHSEMETIISDAKRFGTLKESVLAHSEDYGITQIDYLMPDAKSLNTPPEFISRKMDWVQKVMSGVHHTPFSRIKSMFADITEDDARAKGYLKGNLKKEEVFSLLKRTTTPTTIYKKQKLDRDDVVDITDFDVVAWLKTEMRMMLDEEIARAILVGDGRLSSSDDKINEDNIRPIWKDAALYTIKQKVSYATGDTTDGKTKKCIQAIVRSRKNYKGSGNPTLFTTEDFVTDCLLMEDTQGRVIYDTMEKLKTALRVSDIVTVEVMEDLTRTGVQVIDGDTSTRKLVGILVNLNDYNIGADKGGAINMFDDFDIDYNQQKYLIETRCSGALTKPYSAIAIESVDA